MKLKCDFCGIELNRSYILTCHTCGKKYCVDCAPSYEECPDCFRKSKEPRVKIVPEYKYYHNGGEKLMFSVTENGRVIAMFKKAQDAIDFKRIKEANKLDGAMLESMKAYHEKLMRDWYELRPDFHERKSTVDEQIEYERKCWKAWDLFKTITQHGVENQFVNFSVKERLDKQEQMEERYGKHDN